jgi:Ca-activated chloride channel homolog
VANPYLPKGQPDVAEFSLQVSLAAGSPLRDVQCRSHAARVDYSGPNAARIAMNDTNAANRDFILDYRLTGPEIQPGLLLASGAEENFFLLTIQPPARPAPAQMPAREYIFIVDVSGSMAGFPLSTTRVLMEKLLGTLRPVDSFNLLLFAGDDETFAPDSVAATAENTAAALALLHRRGGGGATNLYPALKHALTMPQKDEVSRSFIVVTDGYIDIEAEAFDLVRSNLGRANLFAFGIGSSVNRHLIEGLARSGLGEPFIVSDPGLAAETAKRFAEYAGRPLLTRAAVKFEGLEVYDVEPRALPDLLADRPLVVFGKWRGRMGGKVTVEGVTGDGAYHAEHDVASAAQLPDAEGLARLWARARVAEQSDLNELKPTEETKAAITRLGLKYNLLTRYTSFVAVDQPIRRVGPSLETIKQPVPLPAGVENSAVGGGSVAAAPEPADIALVAVAALLLLVAWRKRQQSQERAAHAEATSPRVG